MANNYFDDRQAANRFPISQIIFHKYIHIYIYKAGAILTSVNKRRMSNFATFTWKTL